MEVSKSHQTVSSRAKPVADTSWLGRRWRTKPLLHSVVVHGLHKSATMFLFEFFKAVAEDRKIRFYSDNISDLGPPPNDGSVYCHSPVRSFEFQGAGDNNSYLVAKSMGNDKDNGHGSLKATGQNSESVLASDTPSVKRIFHVRDPRDILVSEYFSLGWIHPEGQNLSQRRNEIQQMSVDQYVLQILETSSWPLHKKYDPLMKLDLKNPDFTLVRYEDMVLDFPRWVEATIAPFEFRNPKRMISRYVKKFASQFDVSTESMSHRRKVTPGDHKEKLKPETIEALNERFSDVLDRFGYLKF